MNRIVHIIFVVFLQRFDCSITWPLSENNRHMICNILDIINLVEER